MMHLLCKYDVAHFIRNDAMFANTLGEADIISEGNIISDSDIICRKANIIAKSSLLSQGAFCWWGKVDLNHRSHRQQIYSLPHLAALEFPHIYLLHRRAVWSW